MHTSYQRRWGPPIFALVITIAPLFISWLRGRLSRRIRRPSSQALLRYVQLHNQCSEEEGYQRIAVFVKRHIPLDEWPSVDYMLAYDKRRLLEFSQRLLMHTPDEIDEI